MKNNSSAITYDDYNDVIFFHNIKMSDGRQIIVEIVFDHEDVSSFEEFAPPYENDNGEENSFGKVGITFGKLQNWWRKPHNEAKLNCDLYNKEKIEGDHPYFYWSLGKEGIIKNGE